MDSRAFSPVRSGAANTTITYAAFVGTAGGLAVAGSPLDSPAVPLGLLKSDNTAQPYAGNSTTITDNGVGDFTVLLPQGPARILSIPAPACIGPSNLVVNIQSAALVSGRLQIRFLCKTGAGVATDPAATDFITFTIFGSQTGV